MSASVRCSGRCAAVIRAARSLTVWLLARFVASPAIATAPAWCAAMSPANVMSDGLCAGKRPDPLGALALVPGPAPRPGLSASDEAALRELPPGVQVVAAAARQDDAQPHTEAGDGEPPRDSTA